jgi:hypothetical protein
MNPSSPPGAVLNESRPCLLRRNCPRQSCLLFAVPNSFTTTKRIYCAQTSCERFIPPSRVDPDVANCAQCNSETCVQCKRLGHEGAYSADEALQAVMRIGRDPGWQRFSAAMQWLSWRETATTSRKHPFVMARFLANYLWLEESRR